MFNNAYFKQLNSLNSKNIVPKIHYDFTLVNAIEKVFYILSNSRQFYSAEFPFRKKLIVVLFKLKILCDSMDHQHGFQTVVIHQ